METKSFIFGDASSPELNTNIYVHDFNSPPNCSVQISSEETDISSQLDEFCQDFITISISEKEDQLYIDQIFKKNIFENIKDTTEKGDLLYTSVKNTLDNCVNLITIEGNERNVKHKHLKSFPCPLCQQSTQGITELKNHLMKMHFVEDVSSSVDPSDKMIEALATQIEEYECSCQCYQCDECQESFSQRLPLLKHFAEAHRGITPIDYYLQRPKNGKNESSIEEQGSCICNQCGLLDQIGKMDSDLLIEILLHLEGDMEIDYAKNLLMLQEYNQDLTENQMEVSEKKSLKVSCYSVSLNPLLNQRESNNSHKRKPEDKSDCICPILKCSECPVLLKDFQALHRHVRLRHNYGRCRYHLALLWNKYKVIKEHCGWCCGFSVRQFIVCPHCPYLSFEDEDQAATHMEMAHLGDYNHLTSLVDFPLKKEPKCKCERSFECFTCNNFYRTPQGLHHHMRMMDHENPENFSAIPKMIETSYTQRLDCPRCSCFTNSKVIESEDSTLKPCQCLWVKCNECGNTYKKFNALVKHMSKSNHHADQVYLHKEKNKQLESFKLCKRCTYIKEHQYCLFCNTKVTFLFNHTKTHHQDTQIMIINTDDFVNSYDEYYIEDNDNDLAGMDYSNGKYQCSNCLRRFHYISRLLHHAKKIHPRQYFTLQSISLEETRSWNDISVSELVRILAIQEVEETNHATLGNSKRENYFRKNYSSMKCKEYNRVNKKCKIK